MKKNFFWELISSTKSNFKSSNKWAAFPFKKIVTFFFLTIIEFLWLLKREILFYNNLFEAMSVHIKNSICLFLDDNASMNELSGKISQIHSSFGNKSRKLISK